MRRIVTTVALTLIAGFWLAADAAQAPRFQSAAVRQAQQQYQSARANYERALRRGLDQALADRDSAEATALEAELATLAQPDRTDAIRPLVGRWRVRYSNGGARTYQIDPTGRVVHLEGNAEGRLVPQGDGFRLDFDDTVERLTYQPTLEVEQYRPAITYGRSGPTATGTGVPVQ